LVVSRHYNYHVLRPTQGLWHHICRILG
jgi:hypothetical protein